MGARSFLSRAIGALHSPRRAQPIELPEIWSVGDRAECIANVGWRAPDGDFHPGPRMGETQVVAEIVETHAQHLVFSRYGVNAYSASVFRKVSPRADAAKRADAAFIASLKPARIPAPEAV
jgi:hypothetical protein